MECANDTSSSINTSVKKHVSFDSLGIPKELCEACERLKWSAPTPIQEKAIPAAIKGHDIIGLAETGSGKTGAYAIPVLHALMKNSRRLAALVLAPVRELAIQIKEQFDTLGAHLGVETAVIVGGMLREKQVHALYKKPHIIIATPGRLIDHLENTPGFDDLIKEIRFLIIDEADRMLDMEFQEEVDKILQVKPHDTITYLYSATMTDKVKELERVALTNPVKIEISQKYQTVENLEQYMTFAGREEDKNCYLVHILSEDQKLSTIVFCGTIENTWRTALMLRNIGFQVGYIHGKMGQTTRIKVIKGFKEKKFSILVATDVASRGLDIPLVDVVINLDIPTPTLYIHRVGRAARAGRQGRAITIVSAPDAQRYLMIEATALQKKLPKYEILHDKAMGFKERIEIALSKIDETAELVEEPRKRKSERESEHVITDQSDRGSLRKKNKTTMKKNRKHRMKMKKRQQS